MVCNLGSFEITPVKYSHPIKQVLDQHIERILKAAYYAVNQKFYLAHYVVNPYTRYRMDYQLNFRIWESGYMCIFKNTRCKPVIIMRQLLAYYMKNQGVTWLDISLNTGLTHHSSAIHNYREFKTQLDAKFETPEKEIWKCFNTLINS